MKPLSQLTNIHNLPSQNEKNLNSSESIRDSKIALKDKNGVLEKLKSSSIRVPIRLSWNQVEMRQYLFKWLVAKCRLALQLRINTIEHSIGLFDLYLHNRQESLNDLQRLQLILLSCLFISSKYQEIYPPSVTDFEFVCKYRFQAKDILLQQIQILKAVDYQLNFTLVSDWYFALTRESLPEWSLIVLPKLTGQFSYQQVAQIIKKADYKESKPENWNEDKINAIVRSIIRRQKKNN